MNIEQLSKNTGGMANIFGGTLVAVAYVLHPHHETPAVIASDFWLGVHILFALSLIFGIFGLMAVFQQHIARSRLVGFIGFILATISLIGIFGLNYYEAFINPVVAVDAAEFVNQYGAGTGIGHVALIFPLSGACFVFGYSMLCYDIMRAKSISLPATGVTLIGTLVFGAGLSGFFPMIIVQAGSVLFGCGLVLLGLAVIRK